MGLISLIIAIIVIGFIITIHELGHFLFAKLFSVGVVSFSLGMGPKLISKVYGNTEYSLRLLPIGGSCLMAGEDLDDRLYEDEDEGKLSSGIKDAGLLAPSLKTDGSEALIIDGRRYGREEQFVYKKSWQRFFIVAGGPIFNFLLAFLLSVVFTAFMGADLPYVASIEEDMPAYEAGLSVGDLICDISANGKSSAIYTGRDLYLFLYIYSSGFDEDTVISIGYEDMESGEKKTASFTPRYDPETGSFRMGLAYNVSYSPLSGILEILSYSFYNIRYCLSSSIRSIELLVTGDVSRQDVMGPVRIVATLDETVSEASSYGIGATLLSLCNMMIVISVALGVSNLLPIPALDGGRLIFIIIELLTRRSVPKELEAKIHAAGMVVLLALMVVILINDLSFLV